MSSSGPHSRPQAPSSITTPGTAPDRSAFETQRAALLGEIAISMEQVLANINKLNRALEGVIAVGNEFGSVEALWSQFENVMAREPDRAEEAAERHAGEPDDGASSEDAGGR